MVKRTLRRTPRKQLRAAPPRAAGRYSEDEYLIEEPNVKLSRAFVVVLLLHVVAVGGIFAFSALKDHQSGSAAARPEPAAQKPGVAQTNATRDSGALDKASGKTVPPDVQKLVDSSRAPGGGN